MNIETWIERAAEQLAASGDIDARVDAQYMMMDALHADRAWLRRNAAAVLDAEILAQLDARLSRRIEGEPLQYIEGFAYFMGFAFCVDARVLIPRQDTETLCERALSELRGMNAPEVLDLCTGSGALGISLAKLVPGARVTATDLSSGALTVARENARRLGAAVEFCEGDLFAAVPGRMFDVIVCNPPYLTRTDMESLQREVRHEPQMALAGGEDGLDFYRRIAGALPRALKPGGSALFEVGYTQSAEVSRILRDSMPCGEIFTAKDLCGVERVVGIHI